MLFIFFSFIFFRRVSLIRENFSGVGVSRCNNTYNPKGVKHQECEPVHRLRATVKWNTSIRFYVVIQVYEPKQCSAVHGGQIYMLAPGRVQRWKKIIIGACAAERNQSKIGQGAGAAPVRHSVLNRAHLLPIRLPPAIKEEPPYLAGVDRSQSNEITSVNSAPSTFARRDSLGRSDRRPPNSSD